ncbi:MAG: DUF1049 domain-containing protein [Rubellimicrobium sp.]|nr:DUF1049 domain-containing protein [Rubellimicrobium sp.]
MLRKLLWLFWGVVVLALVVLGLANHETVTLHLLPGGLADLAGPFAPLEVPLFLVIAVAVVAGIVVGLVWEWLRHHAVRAELNRHRRVAGRRQKNGAPDNDVLALLDGHGDR